MERSVLLKAGGVLQMVIYLTLLTAVLGLGCTTNGNLPEIAQI